MEQQDGDYAATGRIPREQIYDRISRLKRLVVGGAIAVFGALWVLAGTHTTGVTAQHAQQHPHQSIPDPGNFFNNAGNSTIGPGGDGGMATSGGS